MKNYKITEKYNNVKIIYKLDLYDPMDFLYSFINDPSYNIVNYTIVNNCDNFNIIRLYGFDSNNNEILNIKIKEDQRNADML